MNRKQKIIISVTGIFIVILILVGLTYAYFLTQITGNTKDKSISITTADLKVIYDDGNGYIDVSNIKPGWITDGLEGRPAAKTFTVYNDGDSVVENYNIYLEDVVNELERTEDLVYTLTCTSTDEENSPCTNQIEEETEFLNLYGTIVKNSIAPLVTHSYTLTLRYKETGTDQSVDMNKQISAKINIYDNNDIENRLNEIIMHDTRITKNLGTPEFTGVEENEVGMYSAPDDYGESWYFRGAQSYNYVKFAGFNWRVVRINGDGSIRLILDGTLDKVMREGESTVAGELSNFNKNLSDNAYTGYMMGVGFSKDMSNQSIGNLNITAYTCVKTIDEVVTKTEDTELTCEASGGVWTSPYDATHMNVNDSMMKVTVDKFYEDYIENKEKNYHYGEYLADTLFCADKSVADTSIGEGNTGLGYGQNTTYYAAAKRLYYGTASGNIEIATPTLECAKSVINTFSRYTSNTNTTAKGISVNSDLTYPIALLSADELVMAGAFAKTVNDKFYLKSDSYWTMTPYTFLPHAYADGSLGMIFRTKSDSSMGATSPFTESGLGVRPVINLKNNVMVVEGDGTINTPYKIGV